MTSLVLGTVQFGLEYGINNKKGRPGIEAVKEILNFAWSNGIKELDTAQAYGDAEKILGAVLSSNQPFIIHSKFSLSNKSLHGAIEESLENLKVKSLGFFFFHKFEDYLKFKSSPGQFGPLGNSRGLGVSLYTEDELDLCLNDPSIKAIQLPVNVFDLSIRKRELLEKAKKVGKKIYARSVFLQGLFFMDPVQLPEKLKLLGPQLNEFQRLAEKHQIGTRNLALGFVKSVPCIDGVLIGVDDLDQLKENLRAWDRDIPESVINELKKISVLNKELLLPKNWN